MYQFHAQKALFKALKICNICIFWIENDPPSPLLELFRKFIRFGCPTRPLASKFSWYQDNRLSAAITVWVPGKPEWFLLHRKDLQRTLWRTSMQCNHGLVPRKAQAIPCVHCAKTCKDHDDVYPVQSQSVWLANTIHCTLERSRMMYFCHSYFRKSGSLENN